MTDRAERLLQEALELDPSERARLAADLLTSLDEAEENVEAAWAAEIERRSKLAAAEPGTDWRIVLDQIRAEVLGS